MLCLIESHISPFGKFMKKLRVVYLREVDLDLILAHHDDDH